MIQVYYSLVLLNAVVSVAVAIAVFWKNRFQRIGPVLGSTMLGTGIWLFCFARYYYSMPASAGLLWGQFTLSAALLINPMYFHSMVELVGRTPRFKWWIAAAYLSAVVFVVMLSQGMIIGGLREPPPPSMAHYIKYNPVWYPLIGLHIVGWQLFGAGVMIAHVRRAAGYKRLAALYYLIVWAIIFLTTSSIIIPLEYNINIPPFGFFVLPLNLALLAYVLARARLADYNVMIARLILYAVTLVIVVALTLLVIGPLALAVPTFMDPPHAVFTAGLVTLVGLVLSASLPRWMPQAERYMQERLFGDQTGYQAKLIGLTKEFSVLPATEHVLHLVTSKIHSEMQVTRVLVLMANPLTGRYELESEAGMSDDEVTVGPSLPTDSAIVRHLEGTADALVREELARLVSGATQRVLEQELDSLRASVCVPMLLEGKLIGILCLGEKLSRDMFFVSDLRLLTNLATEVALAVKYRRLEDLIVRKNRLIELGTIAAGIAHEIRNPLASIRTFAQLLPDKAHDPEFQNEFRRMVLQDVDRITRVIQSMLAFARPGTISIAEYDAAELVDEAVMLVAPHLKSKRIALTKQFHEALRLRCDKQQIIQVLVNLLTNAAQVLPEEGRIRVATGVREMDALDRAGKQKFVIIEVADNGPGVAPAVRHRLFDPFFTTKPEGTGLGLSISQKIVRDHGGIITVSSVEGKGTSFHVNLPMDLDPNKFVQTETAVLQK